MVQTAVQNLHTLPLLLWQPSHVCPCSLLALVLKAGNVKSGNRGYCLASSSCLLAPGVWECSSGEDVGLAKTESGEVLTQHVQDAGEQACSKVSVLYTRSRRVKLPITAASGRRERKVDQWSFLRELLILSADCCHPSPSHPSSSDGSSKPGLLTCLFFFSL